MVNMKLVDAVTGKLSSAGRIFVQTDIEYLAEEMYELFRADVRLSEMAVDANPFSVKTEREKAVEDRGSTVYRAMFSRE